MINNTNLGNIENSSAFDLALVEATKAQLSSLRAFKHYND